MILTLAMFRGTLHTMIDKMPTHKQIAELRKSKNITMQQMADAVGISRPSYSNFESGQKKLSLEEAIKLSDFLGISLESFTKEHIPNNEKYKQMILEFLKCAGKGAKIPKTKLAKLLYLTDFAWFYEHLESMSGMTYKKMSYGPVPFEYFSVMEDFFEEGIIEEDQETFKGAKLIGLMSQTKDSDTDLLSKAEKKLIKKIEGKWRKLSTQQIVSFTHNQLPYVLAQKDGVVSYELITQEDKENVY